jgi:hypothetical protein
MTRSFASAASTVVLVMFSAGSAQAQQPLGFERFTVADVATGVDFGLTELEVFEKYAAAGRRDSRHRALPARVVMAILGDSAAQHRRHALEALARCLDSHMDQ